MRLWYRKGDCIVKIGSKLQYIVPDKCPTSCSLKPVHFDQGAICFRCPVILCSKNDGFCVLEPSDIRDDWAEEWEAFFKGYIDAPRLFFA
jgi:hypothetical protein